MLWSWLWVPGLGHKRMWEAIVLAHSVLPGMRQISISEQRAEYLDHRVGRVIHKRKRHFT